MPDGGSDVELSGVLGARGVQRQEGERLADAETDEDEDDAGEEGARRPRLSVVEAFFPERDHRRQLSRLPSLIAASLRLVWQSGRWGFAGSAAMQTLAGVAAGLQILLLRQVLTSFGAAQASGDPRRLLMPVLGLAAVTSLVELGGVVLQTQQQLLSQQIVWETDHRVIEAASTVDLDAYDNAQFYERLQRAQTQGNRPFQIAQGVLGMITALVGLISLGGVLAAMAAPMLGIVALAVVPAGIVAMRQSRISYDTSRILVPLYRRRWWMNHWLTAKETAAEVRAFGLRDFLGGRHDEITREVETITRRRLRRLRWERLLASLLSTVVIVTSILVLLALVEGGHVSVARGVASLGAMYMIQPRLIAVVANLGALYESALFIDDYNAFLELQAKVRGDRPTVAPSGQFDRIRLDHVWFTYTSGTRPSLRDIDMEIERGQVIALVGENGSGKTTLAKLLARLYVPSQGRILWDGVDTATVDPERLRSSIAVVFQDFAHYLLTAAENVGIGRPDQAADMDAVVAAAQHAGAHEFIAQLPDGYGTLLGPEFDGGLWLSGGQWQRIALARAFFRDAPLIILDEPTAALDAKAEHHLFESMRGLFAGRTVVLISHRFSSVRSADRIFVMRRGRIIENGSHEALMALGGLYAELFTLQAAAYLSASGDLAR